MPQSKRSRRSRRQPQPLLSSLRTPAHRLHSDISPGGAHESHRESPPVDSIAHFPSNDVDDSANNDNADFQGSAVECALDKSSRSGEPTEIQTPSVSDSDSDIIDVYSDDFDDQIFDIFHQDGAVHTHPDCQTTQGVPRQATPPSEEPDTAAHTIASSIISKITRPIMLAALSLYGKPRYTLLHYEHLVQMMKDGDSINVLPSATSMRQSIFPRLLQENFVTSTKATFKTPDYTSTSGQMEDDISIPAAKRRKLRTEREHQAVVILPSSWAKVDVRCIHALKELVCLDSCRCSRPRGKSDLRINSAPHVVRRAELSTHSDTLWINKDGVPRPAIINMVIRFQSIDIERKVELNTKLPAIGFFETTYRKESCLGFDGKVACTLHVRKNEGGELSFDDGLENASLPAEFKSFLNSALQRLREQSSSSANTGVSKNHASNVPNSTRRSSRLSSNHVHVQELNSNTIHVVPSDHITVVQFPNPSILGLYISRFWVSRIDDERNFMVLFHKNTSGSLSSTTLTTFGAPVFVCDADCLNTNSTTHQKCETTGRLEDGTTYYIYRLMLYADDFTARSALFPKGSVGGVYLNPTGLHLHSRRSQSAIRTVSLTPSGISTNLVFDMIIDDLVEGSLHGFTTIDAFGHNVPVFLDVLGFVGDYPASSSVVDVSGHTSICPCTHCTFVREKHDGKATYVQTTSITSSNASYRRVQSRTAAVRANNFSDEQRKLLGLKDIEDSDINKPGVCPLLKFASEFNKHRRSDDRPPKLETHDKDGYALNIIAPDHLITGLLKGVLSATFLQLENKKQRMELQILLKCVLSDYGFQTRNNFFKKSKLVTGLSMSTCYCILTLLPSLLQAMGILDALPTKGMLLNLNRFASLCFWWPHAVSDGIHAWDFVHGKFMSSFHRSLQVLAANFTKSVRSYSKLYPTYARLIDRPNAHRLLELAHHTIPTYNHALYVCELVFESSHQPLKFFLSRNTTTNSHLYSVHLVLARDWLQRIWALWHMHRSTSASSKERHLALLGLLRLLGGVKFDSIDWTTMANAGPFSLLREHVYNIMTGTIEKRLSTWYNSSLMTYDTEQTWELQAIPTAQTLSTQDLNLNSKVRMHLEQLCGFATNSCTTCVSALLRRGFGSGSISDHERLQQGDVIQLILEKEHHRHKFLNSALSSKGLNYYFLIVAFFRHNSGKQYIAVKMCNHIGPRLTTQIPNLANTPLVEIETACLYTTTQLTDIQFFSTTDASAMRKVGVIHNCSAQSDNPCHFNDFTKTVRHTSSTISGGRFFLITRFAGYPPRRS